jgi:H+-transporting ATPase
MSVAVYKDVSGDVPEEEPAGGASVRPVSIRKSTSSAARRSAARDSARRVRKMSESIVELDDTGVPEELVIKPSKGLSSAEAHELLAKFGPNQLPEKTISKWYIFASMLWQPMPVMIWLAAAIEAGLGNYIDMGILVGINLGNASLSFYETTKAGDAIAALKASLKPTASVFRDGKWVMGFDATQLVPGDLIELHSGGSVPADCMLNEKTIDVDEAALTGESLPVTMGKGDVAKMGSTVSQGETHATVLYTGKDTFFGKTASLLKDTGEYSNLQRLLLKIMVILSVLSIALCLAAFLILMVGRGIDAKESASFAVVLLVASIPMAIEIVTTTTLAIGSKELSKLGAIVSRLAAIEDMAGMNMLCSDKTGTLTQNKMVIQELTSFNASYKDAEILRHAAMSTNWKSPPKDALDTLVLRCHLWVAGLLEEAQKQPEATRAEWSNHRVYEQIQDELKEYEILEQLPFNPTLKRTECTLRHKPSGDIFKVTKGAPHVIAKLDADKAVAHRVEREVEKLGKDGVRAMVIAMSNKLNGRWVVGADKQAPGLEVSWRVTGLLSFLDPPRMDTKDTVHKSQAYGVPVKMITGDHALIAKKTAKVLEMGDTKRPEWPVIEGPEKLPLLDAEGETPANLVEDFGDYIENADGFAQVFPEHKFLIVEAYRQMGYKVGMTGDGVNDAPALKRADVGIAVSGATDAARAAADIVLTKEGLSTIVDGIEISRCIFARMKSFLTYRIAATLQLLLFFFIAVLIFIPQHFVTASTPFPHEWPEFFSIPVLFLMCITVINDGTLISVGYDYATPSKFPERWVLPALFVVGSSIMFVATASSLILLYFCLESNEPGSLFARIGLGGLNYGHIVNVIFLKVAISDILSLFSCRTGDKFFFQRKPHPMLLGAVVVACAASTAIALFVPCGHGDAKGTGSALDGVPICGLYHEDGYMFAIWTWLYCIVCFWIQDILKVATWRALISYNAWNINNDVNFQPSALGRCFNALTCSNKKPRRQQRHELTEVRVDVKLERQATL